MQAHDIRLAEQPFKRRLLQPRFVDILSGDKRVHHQYRHAKGAGDTRHPAANITVTDQPQGFVAQLAAFKHLIRALRTDVPHHIAAQPALGSLGRVLGVSEFTALQCRVGLRNMPRQAQHQPQRQLGGSVGVAPRRIEHADTARLGGFGIDVHRIGARAGDHL